MNLTFSCFLFSFALFYLSASLSLHAQTIDENNGHAGFASIYENISFMVTVYERDCSFVTLNYKGETYELVSNVDFSEFSFLNNIEHLGKKYSLLILTQHIDRNHLKTIAERTGRSSEYEKLLKIASAKLPALGKKAGYIVLGKNAESAPDEAFRHIEMLLDYHQLNSEKLSIKKLEHEALQKQKRREKELEDAKPKKPTPVLNAIRKTNS